MQNVPFEDTTAGVRSVCYNHIEPDEVVMNATQCVVLTSLFLCAANTAAQSVEADKEIAVVEVGAAASQSLTGGGSSFGPDLAVEVTPIEHWLELEAGVTPLFTGHSTEWDVDLLFKKPWTLSQRAEFMFGVGPEWVHTREHQLTTNSVAGEAVGDFMFWPSVGKHRLGWYIEPAYDYNFGRGHEQSIGISAGLLIAIR
jgi:hypothetical protein